MAARFVLDSFALLALVRAEPARARVAAVLASARDGEAAAFMSALNACEVLYRVERERGLAAARDLAARLEQLPLILVDATWPRAAHAAQLKASFAISLADAFATTLAHERDATLLTGDPELRAVQHLIAIEWLPR